MGPWCLSASCIRPPLTHQKSHGRLFARRRRRRRRHDRLETLVDPVMEAARGTLELSGSSDESRARGQLADQRVASGRAPNSVTYLQASRLPSLPILTASARGARIESKLENKSNSKRRALAAAAPTSWCIPNAIRCAALVRWTLIVPVATV